MSIRRRHGKNTRGWFRRRRRGDEGVALIELAIAMPFMLMMALGVTEFGLAWTEVANVETTVSSAARTGASQGANRLADYNTLTNIKSSLSSEALANLKGVAIFNATGIASGTVPGACKSLADAASNGGVTGTNACNVYSGATIRALTAPGTNFGTGTTTGCTSGLDQYWCPTTRNAQLSDPPDYLGVYLVTTHNNQTHSYWGNFTITKTGVYRLEPPVGG